MSFGLSTNAVDSSQQINTCFIFNGGTSQLEDLQHGNTDKKKAP